MARRAFLLLALDDAIGIGDIARAVNTSDSNASRAVSQLVEHGLAESAESPDDRRERKARLTTRGKEIAQGLATRILRTVRAHLA